MQREPMQREPMQREPMQRSCALPFAAAIAILIGLVGCGAATVEARRSGTGKSQQEAPPDLSARIDQWLLSLQPADVPVDCWDGPCKGLQRVTDSTFGKRFAESGYYRRILEAYLLGNDQPWVPASLPNLFIELESAIFDATTSVFRVTQGPKVTGTPQPTLLRPGSDDVIALDGRRSGGYASRVLYWNEGQGLGSCEVAVGATLDVTEPDARMGDLFLWAEAQELEPGPRGHGCDKGPHNEFECRNVGALGTYIRGTASSSDDECSDGATVFVELVELYLRLKHRHHLCLTFAALECPSLLGGDTSGE